MKDWLGFADDREEVVDRLELNYYRIRKTLLLLIDNERYKTQTVVKVTLHPDIIRCTLVHSTDVVIHSKRN